jgi:hypothetical protein
MADIGAFVSLTKGYLERNNPIEAIIFQVNEAINNIVTFRSKMKLLKYKFMLARQQLNTMESNIDQGSPYEVRGNRLDRPY